MKKILKSIKLDPKHIAVIDAAVEQSKSLRPDADRVSEGEIIRAALREYYFKHKEELVPFGPDLVALMEFGTDADDVTPAVEDPKDGKLKSG